MRHGVKNNHLGRTTPHRKALLRNLSIALIEHKRIVTTLAKAKALRIFIEPLLTKSKTDTTHQRRIVFSYLQNNDALKELFSVVNSKIANRPGGYTRIIKLERRLGDAADMAMIELVDFNDLLLAAATPKKTTRRSRKAAPKSETTETTVEDTATDVTENPDTPEASTEESASEE